MSSLIDKEMIATVVLEFETGDKKAFYGTIVQMSGEILYHTIIPQSERCRFDKHRSFDFSGTIMLRKAVTCELVENDSDVE